MDFSRTIASPSNSQFDLGVFAARGLRSSLLVGDSTAALAEVSLSVSSAINTGQAYTQFTRSNHGLGVSDPVRVTANVKAEHNVMDGVVAAWVDTNNFTVRPTSDRPCLLTGASPSVYMPLRKSQRGWYTWLENYLGGTLDTTFCAFGGASAVDCLRLVQKVADVHDIAFVNVGMNNIYSLTQDYNTAASILEQLLVETSKRCRILCVLSIPPKDSSDGAWTSARQTIHSKLNRFLYSWCRSNDSKAIFVDVWGAVANGSTYVNSGATNPDPTSAHIHDTTHPSAVGARAIGKLIYDQISNRFNLPIWNPLHVSLLSLDHNLLTDSDFATDTAGIATGWVVSDSTASMSVTPSMVSRTVSSNGDAFGRNQRLTINYGTASGTASTRFRKNNIQSLFIAGQTVQLGIPYSVSGCVGLLGIELAIFGTKSDGTFWQVYGHNLDSNTKPHTDAFSGTLLTPKVVVPSDLSDVDIWVRPYISSAQSTDLVLDLWRPQLVKF